MDGGKLARASKGLAIVLVVTILRSGSFNPAILSASEKLKLHDELFSVSFANEKEGWACGNWGVIWHTGDGGRTWESQESDTDTTLSAIFFLDPQHGWAVGNNGTIVHTADGGRNWTKQKSPVPFFHRDVFFVTPLKGWVASEKTHILYTEDSGETWQVQFQDEVYNLMAIAFSDEEHGWAVGEYGFTYHTEDGGKNWKHQAGFFRVNDETGDVETGVTLFCVVALDGVTGVGVGADGVVARTGDGGKTWNRVDTGLPTAPLFGAAYDGVDTILMGGKGAYLYSPDEGETWKEVDLSPPMTYRWLYGFDAMGAGRFVGVGEEGAIYVGEVGSGLKRVNY